MQCSQCYKCRYCDRYYTKGIKQFNKTKFGWCSEKRAITGIHESCGRYVLQSKNRRGRKLLDISISELLMEITEIRKLLETDRDVSVENEDM